LQGDYVTVVEDRPITPAKYHIPVPFFHVWPKLTLTIAELIVCVCARYIAAGHVWWRP